MANNANINKVIYGNDTLIDLTSDTVTQADVLNSKSFHDASGTLRTGTADISGKADLVDLAPAFSESTAYSKGDYVTYDGDMYRFVATHSAGAWNSNHVTKITVSEDLWHKQNLTSFTTNDFMVTNGMVIGDELIPKVVHLLKSTEPAQNDEKAITSDAVYTALGYKANKPNNAHFPNFLYTDLLGNVADSGVSTEDVAMRTMIAPVFSSAKSYSAGDYVTHSVLLGGTSNLYRFTADHPAGMWTGLDATEVEVITVLDNKVDKVSGKGLSTNDYDNTAKGIVDNIQDSVKANTQLISESIWGESGKNELENVRTSTTSANGVTFTVNDDKSVTVDGTATADAIYFLNLDTPLVANKKYLLSKGINDEYPQINVNAHNGDTFVSGLAQLKTQGEVAFTPTYSNYSSIRVVIYVPNGVSVSNKTVSVMIRDANILDPTYEPYHSSVKDTLRDAEVIEGKNKLPNAIKTGLSGNSVSITESNGALSFSGTASASTYFDVLGGILGANKYTLPSWLVKGNTYTISDGYTSGDPRVLVAFYDSSDALIGDTISRASFTVPSTAVKVGIWVYVYTGTNTSGKVLYPMLRLATETDPTYEPYYIPLKESMFPREEQRVLGAKNLLENKGISQTIYGVTFTVNDDGSVTANGTCNTGGGSIYCQFPVQIGVKLDTNKRYILSGCPQNSVGANLQHSSWNVSGGYVIDYGSGVEYNGFDINDYPNNRVMCYIPNGVTVNNLVFKPMIRLASDPDDTYVPYAMTNKELTDKAYTTSDTAETTIADADYFPFYDTSATGKRKTLWSTIKSVLKTYFDSLYNKYLENNSVTLSTSGTTTVTFTNAAITANSLIQYACTQWDIVPDDITATTGTCTVTMPQVDTAVTVGVRIYLR